MSSEDYIPIIDYIDRKNKESQQTNETEEKSGDIENENYEEVIEEIWNYHYRKFIF